MFGKHHVDFNPQYNFLIKLIPNIQNNKIPNQIKLCQRLPKILIQKLLVHLENNYNYLIQIYKIYSKEYSPELGCMIEALNEISPLVRHLEQGVRLKSISFGIYFFLLASM
jgi:hypothetical protein